MKKEVISCERDSIIAGYADSDALEQKGHSVIEFVKISSRVDMHDDYYYIQSRYALDHNARVYTINPREHIKHPIMLRTTHGDLCNQHVIVLQHGATATCILDDQYVVDSDACIIVLADRDATVSLFIMQQQTSRKQLRVYVHMREPGAQVHVRVLALLSGEQQFSCLTQQLHEAHSTTSSVLVKSIVTDKAQFVYQGTINVARDAQHTRAKQLNKNVLCGERACARAIPSLEVSAHDVSCAHGTASGPLDEQQLWFLQSRGLSYHAAVRLLMCAFIEDVLLPVASYKDDKKMGENTLAESVLEPLMHTFIGE